MTRQHFTNVPTPDPELVRLLEDVKKETENLTGASSVVMPTQHLGAHYGPVHPDIMKVELPERGGRRDERSSNHW